MDRRHLNAIIQGQAAVQQGQLNVARLWWVFHEQHRRRRRRARRAMWARGWINERPRFGLYENLLGELERNDPRSYRNFTRCAPELFKYILDRISHRIARPPNNYRPPGRPGAQLEPGFMLAITLRYLASGCSYSDLMYAFRVAKNTVSDVIREGCQAIYDEFWDEVIHTPSNKAEWREMADEFSTRWNFQHTLGAIDGKHVPIRRPNYAASKYYNYKKFHSIILMAVVDAKYRFIWLNIGNPGQAGDAQIWNNSDLKLGLSEDRLDVPGPEPLTNNDTDIPYFLIGDDAFGLEKFIQKPYANRDLTKEQRIFNYRLSRARRDVENAFGIMSMRFRILTQTMHHEPDVVVLITSVCCILHNIITDRYPVLQGPGLDSEDQDHNLIPGAWRNAFDMFEINRNIGGNTSKKRGKGLRDYLKIYYNHNGTVPWQDAMI